MPTVWDGNNDGARFDLGRRFDGIVGVSTGAILAAGLASGLSPNEVLEFYRAWGPRVFANPVPDFQSISGFSKLFSLIKFVVAHASTPFNSDRQLRAGLESAFGEVTFASMFESRNIALLIPTTDLSRHKVWIYKTPHIVTKHRDNGTRLVDACLASSAAPYFFPIAYVDRPFVDGGLAANNPMMIALIEAMEMIKTERDRPIEIVSVGTCPPQVGEHVTPESRHWGFTQWRLVERFSGAVLDAQVSMHFETARFLLPHLDRPITIFRLHQTEPNMEQVSKLGLDRANPEALGILELLGRTDGSVVHSEVGRDSRLSPLRKIFSNVEIR